MTHETLTSSQLSVKAAALRMVHLPLSVYSSLAQVRGCLKVLGAAYWEFVIFSFSVLKGKLVLGTIVPSGSNPYS